MIYLILDTNNWIYLANGWDAGNDKHHDSLHFELLQSLSELRERRWKSKRRKAKIVVKT